jgi:capsular polysaccharide biosynthesis protein
MRAQALDLRRSLQILRRHLAAWGLVVVLGLLAGACYAVLNPSGYTGTALVALPDSIRNLTTQEVIAGSAPVLAGAADRIEPPMSPQALGSRVDVTNPIAHLLSVNAHGDTAAQAMNVANAVANSYVAYVAASSNPGGHVMARVLERATFAAGTGLATQVAVTGAVGTLFGILIGAIGVLAVGRGDRRLRRRDEIADAIGVPVLASVEVQHPSDAAGWARLLAGYQPSDADACRLRLALRHLGLAGIMSADAGPGTASLTVLSFSSDRRALALGPQLAAFTASQGITTALIIPSSEDTMTAALREACAAAPSSGSSAPSGRLRLVAGDDGHLDGSDAVLTVMMAVVDGRAPRVAGGPRTRATVLGVCSGAATADQLARVSAAAASDGRSIAGILVADPDSADLTTGRCPQLDRSGKERMPARMTGTVAVTRP